MTSQLKIQLINAATAYMAAKKLSASQLAALSDINPAYLSNMLAGKTAMESGSNKPVEITDRWYQRLANTIGFETIKTYWATQLTRQFKEITSTLETCKATGKMGMILGETGVGKTYTINRFIVANPQHTYRLTVSSLYKLIDIVNELAEKVGVEYTAINGMRMRDYSMKIRLDKVIEKLVEIKQRGGSPILIIDEGENLEQPVLRMIKALYDGLEGYCAIVLIGTDQLITKLLNLRRQNRDAIPQLYRRFKACQKQLTPVGKDFKIFLEKYVEDKGLRALLTSMADNYGELHDYLEPAIREADRMGVPLTEEFFRIMHNIPAYQKAA